MIVTAFVPGPPRPKARARIVRTKSGRLTAYTPPETREWEETVATHLLAARNGSEWRTDADSYSVDLIFRLHTQRRVDLDNLVKAVLDAANGVLWDDDSAVEAICAKREWSNEPGVIVAARYEEA